VGKRKINVWCNYAAKSWKKLPSGTGSRSLMGKGKTQAKKNYDSVGNSTEGQGVRPVDHINRRARGTTSNQGKTVPARGNNSKRNKDPHRKLAVVRLSQLTREGVNGVGDGDGE